MFLPSGQPCQKCVYIFKVTSNDKAAIQNGGITTVIKGSALFKGLSPIQWLSKRETFT